MNNFFAGLAVPVLISMLGLPCVMASSPDAGGVPDIIVTAAPTYVPLAELRGKERFPKGAQLLLVHAGKAEPLVHGFAASADASVSYDAQTVLFAGKRAPSDPWQIWELTVGDRTVRKVIDTTSDSERPLYLPGGRMVWAQRTPAGFQLESAEDGHPMAYTPWNLTAAPGILPLTYMRTSAFPADVLHDGRILFESGFPLGAGAVPELYLVYADGSGVESVRCDHGSARWGGAQLSSGDVVFTRGTSLARFSSPFAQEQPVQTPRATFAGAVAETPSGAWLISARAAGEARFSIKLWTPGTKNMRTILGEAENDLIGPVLVAPRTTPHRHPSGLHPWDFANLLALDAHVSRSGPLTSSPALVRLEVQDHAGRVRLLGTAPVERDGSFFVQVPADRPIRFALLDAGGTALRNEHGWFWVRSGEQRICVGCHAGPERAPENRVPDVLLRTTTPVDLTGRSSPSPLSAKAGGSSK